MVVNSGSTKAPLLRLQPLGRADDHTATILPAWGLGSGLRSGLWALGSELWALGFGSGLGFGLWALGSGLGLGWAGSQLSG